MLMTFTRRGYLLATIAAGAALTAGCASAKTADLILHNGKILTVDEGFSIQQAIVVKDGKILAVGGEDLVGQYKAARVIDLKGRVRMPGFTDTHIPVRGPSPRDIDMEGVTSIADIQERIRAKAAELGPGEWVTGRGWDEALLAEKRNPNRADLDAAAPNNPVTLTRAGGHSSVDNSLALKIAKIDRNTPEPKDGLIEKGPDGEPNGVIRERNDLYRDHVPPDTWDQLRPGF